MVADLLAEVALRGKREGIYNPGQAAKAMQ